jgi:hypothetical protein
MVRAIADVTVESAPLLLAKHYRETPVADVDVITSAVAHRQIGEARRLEASRLFCGWVTQ